MKISLVCLSVFLFFTLYRAFDTSLGLASAEDASISTSISASIDSSDNVTAGDSLASASSDNFDNKPSEHNVITSEKDLEPSADIHPVIEEFSDNKGKSGVKQEEEYAFVESISQNAGVSHEVAGTGPGVVHTLVDSATLELQEQVEKLSAAAAASTASTITTTPATAAAAAAPTVTSHHNETTPPTIVEDLTTTSEKSIIVDSADKTNEKSILEIKVEEKSEFSDSNNTHQTDVTEVPSREPKNNITEQQVGEGGAHEDIPSFSEWTQKQLEEAERKKEEQVNSSAQNHQTNGKPSSGIKKRWKNYASPDCGAKIIAANPEAVSGGAVLSPHRDEYTLNTCTSRIWFIVELCEAIQAKKIELANFELFSSSPKEFSIFVSDRFPSRDWSSVGHFTAKDERDVQSFDLHPHLFGKYIKFEMHSHYGSEHYCPISLFRVYGTSEFEVLETENQVHANVADDDDDDETLDEDDGESPRNLFSSAKDAVISIVKKAAEVLGNKGNVSLDTKVQENNTVVKYTPLISTCTTPSHLVVCDNCSDLLFGNVFELLSCKSQQLVLLVRHPLIKKTLYNTDICSVFGYDFTSKSTTSTLPSSYKNYLKSFFPPKYIAAMCNTVAVNECKVVLNISNANATATLTTQDIDKMMSTKTPGPVLTTLDEPTIKIEDTSTSTVITEQPVIASTDTTQPTDTSQIKPTKTLVSEEDLNLTIVASSVIPTGHEQTVHPTSSLNIQNDTGGNNQADNKAAAAATTPQMEHIEMSSEIVSEVETTTESSENLDLDALVTELNGESTMNAPASTVVQPSTPQGQKESVFLRLSNRIKALERNMSLSSQYLEELSRRYKKQVEEMQRLLDKTINTLTEENKKKDERTQRLEDQIISLREAVESLIAEKNSWMHTTYWIFLSGVAVLGTLLFCRRNTEYKQPRLEDGAKNTEVQRRKSIDVITHKTPVKKKRRPSEEALMVGGTYQHLMIDEVDSNSQKASKDKKRKKKKHQLQRSNSITTLNEETTDNDDYVCRTVRSDKGFYFAPKITSSQIWKRQESAPSNIATDWIDETFRNREMQDIPFVLEESEHSSLEPISFPLLNSQSNMNGQKRNGNAIQSPAFTRTATDSRSKRLFHRHKGSNGKIKGGHKKSASFDETTRHKTPSPHGTDTTSLTNNSLDDPNRIEDVPKKEKRSGFKKLFKTFNFR